MKILTLAVPTLLLAAGGALADEAADHRKIAEKEAELAQPGPEHKLLAEMAGPFTNDIKIWPKPGAQPMAMKSAGVGKMILGGRFLQSESASSAGPYKSETMMLLGFDRRSGVYTVHECDTMGTYCVDARGKFDEQRKAIVLSGEEVDPIMGVTQKYDFVVRRISADESVLEMYFKDTSHGNKEPFKMVEITRHMTR